LVAEISASSVSIDLNAKFHVYRRNEVREYIVWRVLDKAVDWFVLRQGRFDRLLPGPDGILRSEVFSGLWLDPAALVRGTWQACWRCCSKEWRVRSMLRLLPNCGKRTAIRAAPNPDDEKKVLRSFAGIAQVRCHRAGKLS